MLILRLIGVVTTGFEEVYVLQLLAQANMLCSREGLRSPLRYLILGLLFGEAFEGVRRPVTRTGSGRHRDASGEVGPRGGRRQREGNGVDEVDKEGPQR